MTTLSRTRSRDCIMVFLREPRLGHVKTRLARHLEEDLVLDLYRAFVLDTLETVADCDPQALILVEPPSGTVTVARWLGDRFTCIGQVGNDLGERMANGFVYAFSRGFQRAVLVGSDTPDLPKSVLDMSFDRLRENQAVIGPSTDGGYYLIGFSTTNIPTDVFTVPIWGTGTVFSATESVLSRTGCRIQVLPEWADIDELPDLKRFLSNGGDENRYGERTRAWVCHHRGVLRAALAKLGSDGGS